MRSYKNKRIPLARHGRIPAVKHTWAYYVFKILGISLTVLLLSSLSLGSIAAWDLSRQVKTFSLGDEETAVIPDIGALSGGVNLLLVGSDSRMDSKYDYGDDPGSELNDVNILLHISADHTNATAISFPRDMYVNFSGCEAGNGNDKINTALMKGGGSNQNGMGCAVKTVENLTGLQIPFAAEIGFDGVIEMSNAVGGVDVCVAEKIEDTHTQLFLEAGNHTLQGVDALKFLRTRYGIGNGSDLTRISSQQVYLSSLIRKIKSDDTLVDPGKLYGLASATVKNVRLSQSLNNIDTLVQVAKTLKPISLENIVFVQFPTQTYRDGVEPSTSVAAPLLESLKNDTPIALGDPNATTSNSGSVSTGEKATAAPETDNSQDPEIVLPSSVKGQTANDVTCSVGRTLNNQ